MKNMLKRFCVRSQSDLHSEVIGRVLCDDISKEHVANMF